MNPTPVFFSTSDGEMIEPCDDQICASEGEISIEPIPVFSFPERLPPCFGNDTTISKARCLVNPNVSTKPWTPTQPFYPMKLFRFPSRQWSVSEQVSSHASSERYRSVLLKRQRVQFNRSSGQPLTSQQLSHAKKEQYSENLLEAKRRRVVKESRQPATNGNGYRFRMKCDKYSIPLNQAIQRRVSSAVLHKLIQNNPSVLSIPDGNQKESSLSILIRHKPKDVVTVERILRFQPKCVFIKDRHCNTPLHIACSHNASIGTVRLLCAIYPEALRQRNFHGLTPFDISVSRTSASSQTVMDFLLELLLG